LLSLSVVFPASGQTSSSSSNIGRNSSDNYNSSSSRNDTPQLTCYAEKKAPAIFWGFWKPKPARDVTVMIGFRKPEIGVSALDCVGETLELTVPNGQVVQLGTKYDNNECSTTATNLSITRATSDTTVPDFLSMVVKVGVVPLDGSQPYILAPQKNKIVSIDATCNIGNGRKSTQSIKITYQNPPRVAISAGFVLATGIKSYGFRTTKTGVGANGIVTTQNELAVTASPTAQFIPFSLVNLYVAGSRTLNVGPQMGIGVNPNLSSPRIEFFASPISVGWHDFYFSPGFHIGQHERLTGGFSVGELTPSSLNKVPIGWSYYTGLGFSFSYNLKPLVKGQANNTLGAGGTAKKP